MSQTVIPKGYKSVLTTYQTQSAIGRLKRVFEDNLSMALNLHRVSAPLIVEPRTGLNDNLTGVERPVEFDVPETKGTAQIVHSLAKWKRMALCKYGFPAGVGIYTDMNAIRREEVLDNTHSIYVDQWDWEVVITREQRTEEFLRQTVERIVESICAASERLRWDYPELPVSLRREVTFITAQELEDLYPGLSPEEREDVFAKEHKTVFIMKIGGQLRSGGRHGSRAPDYDDWSLNGDIIFWHDLLGRALEISSMGIRVDEKALDFQLSEANCDYRRGLDFHKALLAGKLPLTMGGGIGQSRLCMLLMAKAHIGEVQVSIWDEDTHKICEQAGIALL
ncbi:MAG: aspartate--ammonia ligase [Defluviitaleaceae bacterium]|nr:aspartate--ammonia ligase [Defluviitaleaceae bacterium]MCL2835353.1 aspartate--ammonia ligase [Defluviitaleaceae bacterium]